MGRASPGRKVPRDARLGTHRAPALGPIATAEVESMIDVAVEVPCSVKPRSRANEYAT